MKLIKFLLAFLFGASAFGATVSYNTTTGMLLQPTNFFPLHVLSEGASIVRYNTGSNTVTLLVTTNSVSSPGVLPPYSVGAMWINGQYQHLSNIIKVGTNLVISVTDSNVTISSTNAGTRVSWEGINIPNPNFKDTAQIYHVQSGSDWRMFITHGGVGLPEMESMNQGLIGRYTNTFGQPQRIEVLPPLFFDATNGTLSATLGTSATNGTPLSVDAGSILPEANIQDSSEIGASVVGSTNIQFSIVASSISTNKIDSTFLNLLLNQHKVNASTTIPLILTNNPSATGGVLWSINGDGHIVAVATNLPSGGGGGLGTNAFVNGVLQQPFRATNSTDTSWSDDGAGNWRVIISTNRFYSMLTNSLIASNNISIAYDGGALKVMISAAASGGTGTAVTVDGGSDLVRLNLADASTTGLFDLSGTNATFRLPDRDFGAITVHSSGAAMNLDASAVVTTNIADSAVTTAKIADANVTIGKLGTTGTPLSTNFLAGDFSWKQITTNMIPGLVADILSAATNGTAGGGHKIDVNGSHVPNPNLINSSNLVWSVSGSDISAIVTNVPGSTTANVLQRIGGVLFYTSGGTNQSNESYFGVATNILVNNAGSGVPLQATVSLSGAPSTNYVVVIEPYDINSPFSGSSMAYSIRDKTTSGFQFTANYSGSDLGGVWYRIWVIDTVTVGGNGGDVVSTANNNFTATNNFAGPLNAATIAVNDDAYGAGWNGSTNVPTKNAVYDQVELKANIASPALTGNPTAPTASANDNDTSIATTAFVEARAQSLQSSNLWQSTNATLTRLAGIGAGTTGDLLYRDANGWTNLAKGTQGQFLAITATVPAWSNAPSGGGGGDAYLANSQTFTGTNTFSGPVVIGGESRTNWPSSWNDWDEWEERSWTFDGNTAAAVFEPGLTSTAITSGVISGTTARDEFDGRAAAYIRTATGNTTSTGGFVSENLFGRSLSARPTQFKCEFVLNRTNGANYHLGYGDSTTTTLPVDAVRLSITNNVAYGVARSNSVQSQTSTSYTLQQGVSYRLLLNQTNDFVRYTIFSNVLGGPAVQVWTDTTSANTPLTTSRTMGILVGGWNDSTANTNGVDLLYIDHMSHRKKK